MPSECSWCMNALVQLQVHMMSYQFFKIVLYLDLITEEHMNAE